MVHVFLKDEIDYSKDDKQGLIIRLMDTQALVKLLFKALHAFRSYGVDALELDEFKDTRLLEEAHRMASPLRRQEKNQLWIERVRHAIDAAIRRKQFKTFPGGKEAPPQPKK